MAWKPGESGNTKGRPKAASMLARLARSNTQDGLELIEFALRIMRGEEKSKAVTAEGVEVELPPALRERIDAMKWLADRGWGKAVETIEITDETSAQPDAVAVEALENGLGPEGSIQ